MGSPNHFNMINATLSTLRKHSENTHKTLIKHSENTHKTLRKHSENTQKTLKKTLRKHPENTQRSLRLHFGLFDPKIGPAFNQQFMFDKFGTKKI